MSMNPDVLAALSTLLGDRLTTAPGVRAQYATGEAFDRAMPPDAMAFPLTTEEVSRVAAVCFAHGVPMIPSGAATSLEGHITAPHGGLGVNLARMERVLGVNAEDLDCRVEAGVTREALNAHLRDTGLFFPIDPGANATLGGMASTRASGTTAVRYGTMAQNVLGLTVVQPDGTVIRTGGRARKSAAGYDLTHLYVGSEGTLGFITEVALRLYGQPEAVAAATCAFETLAGATDTVIQLIQLGVPIARVEFMDEVQVRASNAYSGLGLPETPHLFFEFHGSPAGVAEQVETVKALAADNGGSDFHWAERAEDRSRLWKARHNVYFSAKALRPGATIWASDVCVPIAALADAVVSVRADIDAAGLVAPIVGHVGDGNFHVQFLLDPDAPAEREAAEAVYARMIHRAIAAGGTCTGEHGIGLVKQKHLVEEAGEGAVSTMRVLKTALDPKGLMNPGKVLP
jgi:D-lactate dehydrogenase (cytochrome)